MVSHWSLSGSKSPRGEGGGGVTHNLLCVHEISFGVKICKETKLDTPIHLTFVFCHSWNYFLYEFLRLLIIRAKKNWLHQQETAQTTTEQQ